VRSRAIVFDDASAYPSPILAEGFEIVALAASAGGLNALTHVLAALPGDFPAPLVVVQHLDRRHRSVMAQILDRCTAIRVSEARSGQLPQPGRAYIAPSDRHLLVTPRRSLTLTRTELVHFLRPSADLLFESVAATYRDKAIAVVLSGTGQDGAMGVTAIRKTGGKVLVQDPAGSQFRGMPDAAVRTGAVDAVLPLDDLAAMLVALCAAPARHA
jgi:two-component system, chemotaxis family, protein-glutamate methylesterase/glutaminase